MGVVGPDLRRPRPLTRWSTWSEAEVDQLNELADDAGSFTIKDVEHQCSGVDHHSAGASLVV
jgi:hypothetical protein